MSELILSLVATGTSQHPRYLISDPCQNFWTGNDWSEEEADGCLFASVNDAGRVVQEGDLAGTTGADRGRFPRGAGGRPKSIR